MVIDPAAFELKDFKVSSNRKPLPRPRRGEKFLRGPILWDWLSRAAQLPGHALHVAIALWFVGWIENNAIVKISPKLLRDMGVERHAMYLGLAALEEAELIRIVERQPGRSPIVEIIR